MNLIDTCKTILKNEPDVVLLFFNSKYENYCIKTLYHMSRFEIHNTCLIALDNALKDKIATLFPRVHSVCIPCECSTNHTRTNLWKLRTRVWSELVNNGISFLQLDGDLDWFKNPLPFVRNLAATHNCDILLSQGTNHPKHIHKIYNFVACCGFMYFRASSRTQSFLQKVKVNCAAQGDDQTAVNNVIHYNKVRWTTPHLRTTCVVKGILKTCDTAVLLLPQSHIPRAKNVVITEHTLVSHPVGHAKPSVAHILNSVTPKPNVETTSEKSIINPIKLIGAGVAQIFMGEGKDNDRPMAVPSSQLNAKPRKIIGNHRKRVAKKKLHNRKMRIRKIKR